MQMMGGNYWEDSLYGEPPLAGLERQDPAAVFGWLQTHLPSRGSKMDWSNIPGNHQYWRFDDDLSLATRAVGEVSKHVQPGETVDHVGDSLSPFGVAFTASEAAAVVGALLEIPEHHYFVARDRSWLVVVSSEGDLDVLELVTPA